MGWVEPEFQALGETFTDRCQRIEEQIAVLRAPTADLHHGHRDALLVQ